jgi:uncharacterized Fe-S cluster-containing protein
LDEAYDLWLVGVLDEVQNQQVTKSLPDEPSCVALGERWENRVDLNRRKETGNLIAC